MFNSVAFPLDQVLKFPLEHAAVKNFFYNIFLFSNQLILEAEVEVHTFQEWGHPELELT